MQAASQPAEETGIHQEEVLWTLMTSSVSEGELQEVEVFYSPKSISTVVFLKDALESCDLSGWSPTLLNA